MTLKTFISGGVGSSGPQQGIIASLIQPAIGLMLAAAVFFFLWNVFNVIIKNDQPEELAKLKSKVIWGVVAIAIMLSVWGLVKVLVNSTGLDNTATLNIRTGP